MAQSREVRELLKTLLLSTNNNFVTVNKTTLSDMLAYSKDLQHTIKLLQSQLHHDQTK